MARAVAVMAFGLGILSASASGARAAAVWDPMEALNREMFAFNEWIGVHSTAAPADPTNLSVERRQIAAMAANAQEPISVAIDLVGGEFGWAANNAARFVVNSTLGVLGTRDAAAAYGLPPGPTDVGLALCRAGWMTEPVYLVLPLAGPTNLRDFGGQVAVNVAVWQVLGLPLLYGYFGVTRLEALMRRVAGPRTALAAPQEDAYAAQRDATFAARAAQCAVSR